MTAITLKNAHEHYNNEKTFPFENSFLNLTLYTIPLNYLCNLLSKSRTNTNTTVSVSNCTVFDANDRGTVLQSYANTIKTTLKISIVLVKIAVRGNLYANESII